MSEPSDNLQTLIDGLQAGDTVAISEFVERFGGPLERIASGKISPQMAKRFGAQSVALSVCRTFVRRSGEGLFELEDGEAMWRLLCAITLTKVREKVRYHQREKRDVGRELQPQDDGQGRGSDHLTPATGVTPAEELEFADTLQHLIAQLDSDEQRLLDMKSRQLENDEIARQFGCSERTVRRMLGRLQAKFEAELRA